MREMYKQSNGKMVIMLLKNDMEGEIKMFLLTDLLLQTKDEE